MTFENLLKIAKSRAKTLILAGLLVAALSFLFLVITQKNFKASSDLLIVQNQSGFTDYYALSKSADFLTSIMVESVYSEKFINEVKNTNLVTRPFLSDNKLDALKEWESMVRISRNPNLGMVHIEVFGQDQNQVMQISNAIITVMTTKNNLFLGSGQNLDVRIMGGPIWEKNPSATSIVLVMSGGFLVGIILSFMWIYYRIPKNTAKTADEYEESLRYLEK